MSNFAVMSFTTKTNKVDLVDAAHMNTVQSSLVTISTALNIAINTGGALNQGTGYPGSPITGQLFYRTDIGQVYIYSGSAWAAVSAISNIQIFTASGTFTAPTGITKVYLSIIGGGGGGGSGRGGGGGAGQCTLNKPYTVVAGNSYTVTIGAGGAGGTGSNGSAGGTTSFDSLNMSGGNAGVRSGVGGAAFSFNGANAVTTTPGVGGYLGGLSGGGGAGSTSTAGGGGGSPFGAGGAGVTSGAPNAGAANTGAGGGGGDSAESFSGGAGGSGICIVSY